MTEMDLVERMDGFEFRILNLERLLGVRIIPSPQMRTPPVEDETPLISPIDTPPAEAIWPDLLNQEPEVTAASGPDHPADARPVPVMAYLPRPAVTPIKQSDLEQTIGLKWAGWIGAVVLVIGVGLGIKFGYDQGWFKAVPPVVRLGLLTLAGAGLIAAGEWVYRKVNVLSAVGLFGAGVAVLFTASYSGHAFYDLYPRNTAFIFMGLCTVIGALVSRRGNMVSIAVLSLIGGNLAPILLADSQPQLMGFLLYLLMLQVTSLTLAFWAGTPKWWTLRGLSLATTCLWVGAVLDQPDASLLLAFILIFAGMFQLELVCSARKTSLVPHHAGTTFSMLVNTATTIAVLYLLKDSAYSARVGSMLGLAGIAALGALGCARLSLKDTALRELSYGYALQSLTLIVVAVPVAFSGIWISAAWGGLAIALALLGWFLDLPAARYAGAIVWALAAGDLAYWTNAEGLRHDQQIGLTIAGIDVPKYALVSWLLALQGQAVARLMIAEGKQPASDNAKFFGPAISIFGGTIWVLAALNGLPPLIATGMILMYGILLLLLDLLDVELNFLLQAETLILAATLKWIFFDLLAHRFLNPVVAESIFFSTRGCATIILVCSLLLLNYRVSSTAGTNRQSAQLWPILTGVIVGVFFWLGSFAIDQVFINQSFSPNPIFSDPQRAEQVALSIFWSFFALASVAAGFGWRTAGLRYVGLAVFALTLLKVVAIDLSQVSTGYRILSFIGLGILLLGTSVLYGKVSPIILANNADLPAASRPGESE